MKTKILKIVATALVVAAFGVTFLSSNSEAGVSPVADGPALYKSKCASCHAADGSGNTPVGKAQKLRDLRSADVQNQTDAQLYAVVAKGKGEMPGYEKSLGADSCQALVAHLRKLGGR